MINWIDCFVGCCFVCWEVDFGDGCSVLVIFIDDGWMCVDVVIICLVDVEVDLFQVFLCVDCDCFVGLLCKFSLSFDV